VPPLPRGDCPVCGAEVALRKGGLLREHRAPIRADEELSDKAKLCPGSGDLPAEHADGSDVQTDGNGQPGKELLERVGELDRRIRERVAGIRRQGIDLAEDFHAFNDERGWELQDCETVKEYLADPSIEIPYSTYRGMVQVFDELVVKRGIEKDRLAPVAMYKLQIALKKLRDPESDVDIDEVISDAEVLGPQDFRAKYRGALTSGQDDGDDGGDEVECPACHHRFALGKAA
jgi:hypothetical protein